MGRRPVHTDRESRSGRLRVYFRRRLGAPKIRLRAPLGSREFLAEYEAAREAAERSVGKSGVKPYIARQSVQVPI